MPANELSLPAATGKLVLTEAAEGEAFVCKVLDARLEARNSFALKKYLAERLATKPARFILDLSDVSFIDSSGLGALISGLKDAADRRNFILVRPQASARAVFSLTRTEALFTWADHAPTAAAEPPR